MTYVKCTWGLFVVAVLGLAIFFLASSVSDSESLLVHESEENEVHTYSFKPNITIKVNWSLLNASYSQDYIQFIVNPLPCNTSREFSGAIVPLPAVNETFNSDCIRAQREYDIPKPPGVHRVLLLGDSFVFGWGVMGNETVSSYLQRFLNYKNNSFEVMNLGVSGYNTKLEIERLIQKGLKYEPDLVIVGYFHNDLEDTNVMRQLVKLFRENNLGLDKISELKSSLMPEYFEHFPFNESFLKNVALPFEKLKNLSSTKNFSVLVYAYPLSGTDKGAYIKLLNSTLARLDIPFYYLEEEIGYKYRGKWILHIKDIHPTPYSNSKTAQFLASVLD